MQNFINLMLKRKPRIAVLIDADNIPRDSIEPMLDKVSQHGNIRIIRAYGNWAKPIKSWKSTLEKHRIVPVHVYNSAIGKNSADILLVIDAMDIMHDNKADIICIASSDSDFARLAIRIRESNIDVIFAGEKKKISKNMSRTNEIFIDVTVSDEFKRDKVSKQLAEITALATNTNDFNIISELIAKIGKTSTIPGGWAFLGTIGNEMKKVKPGFSPKAHGFDSLSELILAKPEKYETFMKSGGATAPVGSNYIYVRNVQPKAEVS
jgi:uncharacterized protein (TIGR00288 family)